MQGKGSAVMQGKGKGSAVMEGKGSNTVSTRMEDPIGAYGNQVITPIYVSTE